MTWFVLLVIIVVLVILFDERPLALVRRRMRELPRAQIETFVEGLPARVVGRATAAKTVVAPITGRPCVFYEVVVEVLRSTDDRSDWCEIIRTTSAAPFSVADASGIAIVEAELATLTLANQIESRAGVDDPLTSRELTFLRAHGRGNERNQELRFTESVIEPGAAVAVAGHAVREPDPTRGGWGDFREGPPLQLRFRGTERTLLIISDKPDVMR